MWKCETVSIGTSSKIGDQSRVQGSVRLRFDDTVIKLEGSSDVEATEVCRYVVYGGPKLKGW